jgi:hypothetical protein
MRAVKNPSSNSSFGAYLVLGILSLTAACDSEPVNSVPPGPPNSVTSPSTGTAGASSTKPSKPSESTAPDDSDGGVPNDDPLREDGDACRSDDQCQSDHCENRLCCSRGACCRDDDDCGDDDGDTLECTVPSECRGQRGPATCRANRCVISRGDRDDSACDAETVAADCGLYADVYCNGDSSQDEPECADSCESDEDCDADSHCEDDECVADRDDGGDCARDAECESNSCSGGRCCSDGDCCTTADDCPESYTYAARCDDPDNCQGTSGVAQCVNGKCESETTETDTGCGFWIPSTLCGQARQLYCRGGEDQQAPTCGDGSCFSDGQCDNSMHCVDGQCTDDLGNGESCDRDAICGSNHCSNGLCCDGGVCCRESEECADSFECVDPGTCQGERYVNECSDFQCTPSETTEDDSVCWGRLIDSCNSFADLRCSGDMDQDTSERECTRYCISSWQCDPGLQCAGPYCYLPEDDDDD